MDALCVKMRTRIATALPDDLQLEELPTVALMLRHRLEQAGAKALAMRDQMVTEQGLEELIRHLM